MHFTTLITTIAVFIASAWAAASVEADHFELSQIKVDRSFSGNFSVSFTVHDPDPLTNATQECSGSWKYGSQGFPQGSYSLCGNSTFGWNMASFNGFQKFTLGIQHRFSDPAIGEPPYDSVTTYGDAVVNKKNLLCEKDGESVSCAQKPEIILAPITRVSS